VRPEKPGKIAHKREGVWETALEEEFGGDVEAAAKALDVVFVELALAAQDLRDDAGSAEDIGEVFLQETVLVHQELEDFEGLGARQLVVAVFEILDQKGQEFSKFLLSGGQFPAAVVEFVKKLGAGFIFLLGTNHAGREFFEKLDVFRASSEGAHSLHPSLLYSA
jgi:hypothetical protein